MTLSQELLRQQVVHRILRSRPDLAWSRDLSSTAELIRAHAEVTGPANAEAGVAVVCVVHRFDPVSLIRDCCAFAASLTPEQAEDWRRSFTRTVFLAGNPANLLDRFAFQHVCPDGVAAWTAPSPAAQLTGLRRLLKLFDGPRDLPVLPVSVARVPGSRATEDRAPVRHDLYVATAGVTVADTLVNLNHLLTEAVLDGLIRPGDRLVTRSVPWLAGVRAPFEALRVDLDRASPDRLRAYAGLTRAVVRG